MTVQEFVNQKAQQLSFYLKSFWQGEMPFKELELFFWDTMEEWGQIAYSLTQPYTQKERVFWHVLHQLQFWTEETLLKDQVLIDELKTCVLFLDGNGHCPFDCVGIRP